MRLERHECGNVVDPTCRDTSTPGTSPVVLHSGGVGVVLDTDGGLPRVLHWGAPVAAGDLELLSTLGTSQHGADGLAGQSQFPAVLPQQSSGWMGTPGLEGHREGRAFSTLFSPAGSHVDGGPDTGWTVEVHGEDEAAQLTVMTRLELTTSGVLRLRAKLTNTAPDTAYTVNAVRLALPVPAEAQDVLDFAGRHLRERIPQRHPFRIGTHLREGRRGRTGTDASLVLAAGTAGFGFRTGRVWAVHTAWSGNHSTFAELGLTGVKVLGGGEVLLPGEVVLAAGESYESPWLYAAYGEGLDAVSAGFHSHLRAREGHPSSPRPVVVNTWEAVYFDHDLDTLVELAELGARVGAERFVLDDGWFLGRRDDSAGLGDWRVDPAVWPQGLGPLVEKVRALGMDFGLWFEPEMVNEDSEIARAHPEWILASGERLPLRGRNQHVLNLTIPEAFDHVLKHMSALIAQYSIDYVKWDHNRDLVEAGDRVSGHPRVHAQTMAVYALMDELKRRHPGLEIESCSSGGGRIDLEVLQHTDRVWASDCMDALERQRIHRWTSTLLPPELIGSHVGATTAHTTHRTHVLGFRAATALFGHFGIEWDLREASEQELDELAAWVALYKEEREILHGGTVVRSDHPDPTYWAHGVVAADRRRALFSFVAMDTMASGWTNRIGLPGLDPETRYRIEPIELSSDALVRTRSGYPTWWTDPMTVSGRTLETVGLQGPMLYPEHALLFRLVAE